MTSNTPRLVRLPEAMRITGLGRSSFLRLVRDGEIQPPVRLTLRAVAWREADLFDWVNTRPVVPARRGPGA